MKKIWWDEDHRLQINPLDPQNPREFDNDNGELHSVKYWLIDEMNGGSNYHVYKYIHMEEQVRIKSNPAVYKQRPNSQPTERSYLGSHDNIKALMGYAFKHDLNVYYENFQIWPIFKRPDNLVIFSYWKYYNTFWRWPLECLLWIPMIMMLWTIIGDDKGDVSGDWLAFVILESSYDKSYSLDKFYDLMRWLWKRRYGDNYLHELAKIYHWQHADHPLTEITK